ncbi:MAG: tight adherence protein [Cryptosporangiaceae bacterium]|nr:tight adherence protein [Cryptosporangiaceae bacterium]
MRARLAILAGLALALAPAAAQAAPAADLAVSGVRSQAGSVSFLVSARGLPAGASLADARLTVRAGTVDLPTRIGTAEPAIRTVLVVVDTSGSMAGTRIAAARSAATAYGRTLPADVRIGLVTVADHATTALAPTTDRTAFAAAVGRLTAAGGTALYDGVAQAARLLGTAGLAQTRLLVLSDGADTSSRTGAGGALAELLAAGAPADVVGFQMQPGAQVKELAEGSGGRLFSAGDATALADAFRFAAGSFTAPVRITASVPAALDGRTLAISVQANLAGRTVTAQTPPAHLTGERIDAAPRPAIVRTPPGWQVRAVGLLVFSGLFLLLAVGLRPALARVHQRRRLGEIGRFTVAASGTTGGGRGPVVRSALQLSERIITKRGSGDRTAAELDRAGLTLRPHEWLVLRAVAAAAGALLGALAGAGIGLLVGAAGGWLATRFYRTQRTARRAKKFGAQLPDALQLVVGSLQSGFSLSQAMSTVVRDTPDPLGPELGRALASTRLGGTLEDGLDAVAERVGSQDLGWAVMTIRIQREVGGNLAEVLETAVVTMREREGLRRHVRALSAEGRLSAYVLTAMPIGVAGWMFMIRREYLAPLYTTGLGIVMLVASVVMVCFGAWWMSKLVKVDV